MWAASAGLVVGLLVILLLALGLSVTIGAPILAVPFFVIGFGAFLVWRGKRRADANLRGRYGNEARRVPSTEETAPDPVADSGVAEATRAHSDART
jgi:threonine/homoserine/homoserine lactone efflux protein